MVAGDDLHRVRSLLAVVKMQIETGDFTAADLIDLPNAPVPATFTADQQALAASMRTAWVNFAATGNPASAAVPWPGFSGGNHAPVLSLVAPQPQVETDFAAQHHCSFWAAG